jgi:PPOX class probable F420-dependent enzyme
MIAPLAFLPALSCNRSAFHKRLAAGETMGDERLAPFANQKYLSVESYRKTGAAVATAVWFAEAEGVIYIYSLSTAGKVKRIRNNPRVRIAPCDIRGRITGQWVEAEARILSGAEDEVAHRVLNRKYGWVKRLGNFFSRLRGRENVTIAIRLL